MHAVRPSPPAHLVASARPKYSRRHYGIAVLSLMYLVASLMCSWWYVALLRDIAQNDALWHQLNESVQAWMMEAMNVVDLVADDTDSAIDLTSLSFAFDQFETPHLVRLLPTYSRRLLYTKVLEPALAIASCRQASPRDLLWISTQFCWVDFGQAWELGHTAKRQLRCEHKYAGNGAVFLEALLRNTDMAVFLETMGGPNGIFTAAVGQTLQKSANGRRFLAQLSALVQLDVPDEVAYWATYNVTTWVPQLQNYMQVGLANYVTTSAATGLRNTMSTANMPKYARYAQWTTWLMSIPVFNDMTTASIYNCSIVRSDPTFLWDQVPLDGYDTGTMLLYDTLGPLYTIDLYFTPVPRPLMRLYRTYMDALHEAQWQNAVVNTVLQHVESFSVESPPIRAWQHQPSLEFVSGNPLCPSYETTTPYALQEWGFEDACLAQLPLRVGLTRRSLLFAVMASKSTTPDQARAICASVRASTACFSGLSRARQVADSMTHARWNTMVRDAKTSISTIEIVQLALAWSANATRPSALLLRQKLVDESDPVFSFLGWSYLFDWVEGTREVVLFEGDVGSYHLISHQHEASVELSPIQGEIPRSIALLLSWGVGYVSVVQTIAVLYVLAIAAVNRLEITSRNLWFFHRVGGLTWVGRPLLFLRGFTAILVLCSAYTELQTQHGLTKLSLRRRTLLESMVLAGEATWVSYVAADVVLLKHQSWVAAPLSSAVAFGVALALDVAKPVVPVVVPTQDCRYVGIHAGLICTRNTVFAGDAVRVAWCLGGSVVVVVIAACSVYAARSWFTKPIPHAHVWYTGSALAYFDLQDMHNLSMGEVWLDQASNFMCGIVVLRLNTKLSVVLDIKSWQCLRLRTQVIARRGTYNSLQIRPPQTRLSVAPPVRSRLAASTRAPLKLVVLGFLYVLATLGGSWLYLSVLADKMSNDFWWANFNTTGGHRFLAMLLQRERQPNPSLRLDGAENALVGTFDGPSNNVPIYASQATLSKHSVLQHLPSVVKGFRQVSGCVAPWIAAQYCWVDFDRQWGMANTAARQRRCARRQRANAAVYLEPLVRNINMAQFIACWGEAFEIAIARELKQTADGKAWLRVAVREPRLSVDDEVSFWTSKQVDTYVVQWQNYKLAGLVNAIVVENAFGAQYTLTFQSRNASWRVDAASSLKLYWPLANYLGYVASSTNATSVPGGQSLIRQSADFAFANTSVAAILESMHVLMPPVESMVMDLFQRHVGPYGSVDITYVAPPEPVVVFLRRVEQYVQATLFNNATASVEHSKLPAGWYQVVVPFSWQKRKLTYIGGSPLCQNALVEMASPYPYWDTTSPCRLIMAEEAVYVMPWDALIATIASGGGAHVDADATCSHSMHKEDCYSVVACTTEFIQAFMPESLDMMHDQASHVGSIAAAANVSLLQFALDTSKAPVMVAKNVFDSNGGDPGWRFWMWCYLYMWSSGQREVISLEGDAGHVLTVLSTAVKADTFALNALEIPHSMALYFLRGVQYVTLALVAVAGMLLVYIVTNRGHVEPWNLLKLNRVGALVWVGRPLLLLRAVSALCLLSTGQLLLRPSASGLSAKFECPSTTGWKSLVQAVVVSGEVCWSTYIIHDIASIWTTHYTRAYASKSYLVVWAVMAVVEVVSPLHIEVTLDPTCVPHEFDMYQVCTVGHVAVGSVGRLGAVICMEILCIMSCFGLSVLYLKYKVPDAAPDLHKSQTLFLYSLAAQVFALDKWRVQDVLYLDKASALLNGLVAFEYNAFLYMIDVKTWRLYRTPKPTSRGLLRERVEFCLPMASEWQ